METEKNNKKPISNPTMVLREEFDDWAILFDPDANKTFGLNPISVFIWKCLDGAHTQEDILKELNETCNNVPPDAKDHIKDFIEALVKEGLAGYEVNK